MAARMRSGRVGLVAGVLIALTTGCHGLLDVSDPTYIQDADIANASGANARRLDVVYYLNTNAAMLAMDVALITDEWTYDKPIGQFDYLDKRDSEGFEAAAGTTDLHLGWWDRVFYKTSIAIPTVRAYAQDSLKRDFLAQLYAIRGYAVLQIAEDICPGFPLNDVTPDNQPVFSGPLTTDSAVAFASVQLDSAIADVQDSARFAVLARVTKGRALLDQGRYAEAAAVVASVPTDSVYQTDGNSNAMFTNMRPGVWTRGGSNRAVGDGEGGNGLPFVSAHDPRIPTALGGPSATNAADTLFITTKYRSNTTPFVLASGVEARLIEAEAALHAGDGSWLTILNTLRASIGLPNLVDPGTPAAQVDLLYRERAFWLYLTGRRLGDLRRLIARYGRNPESVFPTGAFPSGGTYGTATAIPFVLAAEQLSNPHITTGCTTR
jgi:hypothetical protein